MSGKVNCTCGWSWNKSDSSKKDMYICHECGRDNSNNMKNGGWLDNIPQAQEGTQTMNSRQKKGVDLQIKELKKEQEDEKELRTTGTIKQPRSIAFKNKQKDLAKKQTYVKQDTRSEAVKKIDEEKGKAKEFKKTIKPVIQAADVATDIMQLGNFVPHPIGQTIGKIGNLGGATIDAYQAYDDLSEGNYTDAAINAGSVFLPMTLGSQTFRRNSKYLQPGQPLYPFSPQARNNFIDRAHYIEPFNNVKGMTDASLLANRALLGTLGAETLYDIPKQKNGGWLDNYNDSQVSTPEGMVGDGYSNVGRNYSPAWGGQFQMGGSLPGATGNMYARHGAPSKGPRRNQTDVTDASAQNGKEMQYYQNGLDWKPKSISRDGSVIKDDRGQWDHPGEITEIGSNQITMQGVPYDVLGISDTGDTKLMKPGKDYKFKGKKVTEYPMAKNGLRQEQKGLQNLDNLTNFTNYNKPQPGGWLDNY